MFFWWGKRTEQRPHEVGTFQCQWCGTEQPYRRIVLERVSHFCSIPVVREPVGEYLECQTCKRRSPVDHYVEHSAGEPRNRATWTCPHCHNVNDNGAYRCLKCGQSLV